MISIGNTDKLSYFRKKNMDKLTKLVSMKSIIPLDYGEKRYKNAIKLTLKNIHDYKD